MHVRAKEVKQKELQSTKAVVEQHDVRPFFLCLFDRMTHDHGCVGSERGGIEGQCSCCLGSDSGIVVESKFGDVNIYMTGL
jgi:hypothetical protein